MDTSAVTRKATTDAKKEQHHKEGWYFKCSQQGHLACNCPNRKPCVWTADAGVEKLTTLEEQKFYTLAEAAAFIKKFSDEEREEFVKSLQALGEDAGFQMAWMQQLWFGPVVLTLCIQLGINISRLDSWSIHWGNELKIMHSWIWELLKECFIHPRLVNKLGLKERPLQWPWNICNVDGTINQAGKITTGVELTLKLNGKPCNHLFFITNIGEDDIILGYFFFESFNPTIDWEKGQLSGEVVAITKGEETLSSRIAKTIMATQLVVQAKKDKKTWDQIISEQYHQYKKVFQEDASEQFPGPRKWDHAIDLKPDAPTSLDCCVYPLSPAEKQTQKEFIAMNLQLERICRSKSQYACGFFFVRKKDRKLRPVQDYQKLNEWTIPNRYSLPLITDLIHDLADKKLFTKFDVCWGYNNIRLKEGNE
jgi:hypothetical protein